MRLYRCDRCDAEIEATSYKDRGRMQAQWAGGNSVRLDLCPLCENDLITWLKNEATNDPEA